MLQVAEPLGRNERHDADDRIAYGEDAPEDANGLRVPDVVRRVHVRRLDVLHFRAHLFSSIPAPSFVSAKQIYNRYMYVYKCSCAHDRLSRGVSRINGCRRARGYCASGACERKLATMRSFLARGAVKARGERSVIARSTL